MTGQPTDSQHAQKEIAFYSKVVEAWVATRMEKDKTLLSLATGGIGLLVTLLSTLGASSPTQLLLYGSAGVSFIGSSAESVGRFRLR